MWLYNKCWGKKNRAYEKNIKKVEHKFEKSVKKTDKYAKSKAVAILDDKLKK